MYDVQFSSAVERYFKKLKDKDLKAAYRTAIEKLRSDPHIGVEKHGDLRGILGYDIYHKGVNYEIAYRVYEADSGLVVIVLAGTRENFYQQLKRYIK